MIRFNISCLISTMLAKKQQSKFYSLLTVRVSVTVPRTNTLNDLAIVETQIYSFK